MLPAVTVTLLIGPPLVVMTPLIDKMPLAVKLIFVTVWPALAGTETPRKEGVKA